MFSWPDLDERVRTLMLEEITRDEEEDRLYIGRNLAEEGRQAYPALLKEAVRSGNEMTLAERLRGVGLQKTHKPKATAWGRFTVAKVEDDAAYKLASTEFNRFYMRGLCLYAMEKGVEELVVFRGRPVDEPRSESLRMEGRGIPPERLLADLRENIGGPTRSGLGAVNSGLCVRLP